jgi:D-sedoheptulose 7-phosphate isomerase
MNFTRQHLEETVSIVKRLDVAAIEKLVNVLARIQAAEGRIFFLGVGGSAGNCSHAVNDFRKLLGIECYAPTDNVSELTARINDDGWQGSYAEWLRVSRLQGRDAVFILSVGGGSLERNISVNLIAAVDYARARGAKIVGILGRDGGYTAQHADASVIIPTVNPRSVTPHCEALQAVIWHLLVSHPRLSPGEGKWESVER